MSTQQKPEYSSFDMTAKDVADYLEQNPDFFLERDELLLKMAITHGSGDAISILEYQTERLREHNARLQEKLRTLVSVARENDRLGERIHRLILSLLAAKSIDEVIENLETAFKRNFQAECCHVYLFHQEGFSDIEHQHCVIEKNEQVSEHFKNFFKANRPLCGRLKEQQLAILFNDQASQVGSAVLLPLGSHGKLGMIAIGSADSQRFSSSMGTIYLNQLADVITQSIKRYL
jgi:uncharacterized protein YigA (DUF484 family)